jgi:phosphatidylglycerophosphate synthase
MGWRPHAGDVLTAGRIALTPVFAVSFLQGLAGDADAGLRAGALFALIALSDYLDGPLARRVGRASDRGRVWDSWADILFLETALVGASRWGVVPWWVPVSVAASFLYYVADSQRRTGRGVLVASRLGHLGGVCNYILVGVLTYDRALGLDVLGPGVMSALFLLVPIYSFGAIAARMLGSARAGGRLP